MTANWEALTMRACSGQRELGLTLGVEALDAFNKRHPGACGALLTQSVDKPTVPAASLRVVGSETRFFADGCRGESGARAPYCAACGLVRKQLRPQVLCARTSFDASRTETIANRARRGMLEGDYRASAENNTRLEKELAACMTKIESMVTSAANGQGSNHDPISMVHTHSRAEAKAALQDMKNAEAAIDTHTHTHTVKY
jgi:hypothetical protein